MDTGDTKKGIAFFCDREGVIQQVLLDDCSLFQGHPVYGHYSDYIPPAARKPATAFFDTLFVERSACSGRIEFTGKTAACTLFCIGFGWRDLFFVAGAHEASSLGTVLASALESGTSPPDPGKNLRDNRPSTRDIARDSRLYEDLVRLNNELVNMQRNIVNSQIEIEMQQEELNHEVEIRRMAEEALQLANKKLGLLSSITRHDILNQLNVLIGYLDMDLEAVTDPGERGFIEVEMQTAKTIQRQIEFTREYQELGMQAPVWLNVNKSLTQATAGLPIHEVAVSIDRTGLEVYADRLFDKVFYNLIENALRYGGEKMTSISVLSHEDGKGLIITFEDNGAGISAEDKQKLFTRGFGKNTGLGLFLSREILAITGITIEETGEPGKGARFEITVPTGMFRFTGGNPDTTNQ